VNCFKISVCPISLIFSVKQIIDLDGALLQRHPDEGQPLGRSLDDAAQAGDVLDRELPPELLFQAQNFEEVTISVAQTDLKSNFTILYEIEIQFKRKVCVRFTMFLRYSVTGHSGMGYLRFFSNFWSIRF